jgi:hypothetical protein
MSDVHVSTGKVIGAPAEKLYRILADYKEHHPRILPEEFSDLTVEEGGVGEGTVVRFRMRNRAYRMNVTEPNPGRVLTEHDSETGIVRTFVITPTANGSRVEIGTTWTPVGPFSGVLDRIFARGAVKKAAQEELERLDDYVQDLSA